MGKIYVSYRREDSTGVAGRIYDRLRAHFGTNAVITDTDLFRASISVTSGLY